MRAAVPVLILGLAAVGVVLVDQAGQRAAPHAAKVEGPQVKLVDHVALADEGMRSFTRAQESIANARMHLNLPPIAPSAEKKPRKISRPREVALVAQAEPFATSWSGTARVVSAMQYLDATLAPAPFTPDLARWTTDHLNAGEPRNPVYESIRSGQIEYRKAWGHVSAATISSSKPLRKGDRGPSVDALFHGLGIERGAGQRFDATLEIKVRAFQRVHGLRVNGTADRETLAALSRGSEYYEDVIAANLERARWLPNDMGGKFVLVNTAAAQLLAYEQRRPVLEMKVVVGRIDRPTPALADRIEYIVANPNWNLPPHLVKTSIAPRVIEEGIDYLRDNGFVVLSDWSDSPAEADPASVDWQAVSEGRTYARVRQTPGRGNPMGELKFMFPNALGIYLHDTPRPELFAKASRYFSNGCVRLEDPQGLARFLAPNAKLGARSGTPRVIALKQSIPVFVGHFTFWAEGGELKFHPDVYQRDPALLAVISRSSNAELMPW